MTPTRITWSRYSGPLPEGARYVGRPSRWGNPHKVCQHVSHEQAVARYRRWAAAQLLEDPEWLDPLRSATALACSCRPGLPCHVDVLVELLAKSPNQTTNQPKKGIQ